VGLTFEEDGDEIRTVGLGEIGQTEFMTKVSAWTDVEEARKILFQVAAYIVSNGTRLRPGDSLSSDEKTLRLRDTRGYLEVIAIPGDGR